MKIYNIPKKGESHGLAFFNALIQDQRVEHFEIAKYLETSLKTKGYEPLQFDSTLLECILGAYNKQKLWFSVNKRKYLFLRSFLALKNYNFPSEIVTFVQLEKDLRISGLHTITRTI